MNPQKPKTIIKMGNQKKYKVYRMNCVIGYTNSGRIWLMIVLQQSLGETQSKESQDTSKSSPKVELGSGKHSV